MPKRPVLNMHDSD